MLRLILRSTPHLRVVLRRNYLLHLTIDRYITHRWRPEPLLSFRESTALNVRETGHVVLITVQKTLVTWLSFGAKVLLVLSVQARLVRHIASILLNLALSDKR